MLLAVAQLRTFGWDDINRTWTPNRLGEHQATPRRPLCPALILTNRPGYRRRRVEQHVIYFRPTDFGIAVMRILNQRMDAPRHL